MKNLKLFIIVSVIQLICVGLLIFISNSNIKIGDVIIIQQCSDGFMACSSISRLITMFELIAVFGIGALMVIVSYIRRKSPAIGYIMVINSIMWFFIVNLLFPKLYWLP